MHFAHSKRYPQQVKIKFVAESAKLLLFFDHLCCLIIFAGYNNVPLKMAPQIGKFAESATEFAESRTVCGIHRQIIRQMYS